ncbi:Hypothetical protein (Fragment), partial [Durusdinium trenchii]
MLSQNGRKRPHQGKTLLAPCLRRRTSVATPARTAERLPRAISTARPNLSELKTVVVNLERRSDRMEGCCQRLQKHCQQLPFERFNATDGFLRFCWGIPQRNPQQIPRVMEKVGADHTVRSARLRQAEIPLDEASQCLLNQRPADSPGPECGVPEATSYQERNMFQAKSAHRKAIDQQDRSSRAHDEAMSDNMGMYHELQSSLEQKVRTSQRMLEKLQHRAQSLENSIQHTKQTLGKLEEALEAKDAPLILCSWRMEQRERRPLREQVRDHVEVSLETEKAALLDSQRRLQDVIQKTKQTVQALENKLEEVRQDIQQKSQALSVDELCLRTTSRSLEQIVDRSAFLRTAGGNLPPARGGSRGTARGADARREVAALESFRNEVLRQKEALRLNQSAIHREEAAKVGGSAWDALLLCG